MSRDTVGGAPAMDALRSRFYQSLAETLVRLRTPQGHDARRALTEVVATFASIMQLPLAWVGRRSPEDGTLAVLAAAGTA
ncbi:MAG: hypothetical protein KGN77_17355, partial [Xanthomonadaceae bacterium]|nr:hypothetical protein [Xanthomonadaceae bacterium]